MAYRFNNGNGGVTCDMCQILYDANLSLKEYEESYGQSGDDGDICWECMKNRKKTKREADILDDGWRN